MDLRITILCFILATVQAAPNDEVAAELFINQTSDKLYDIVNIIDYGLFTRWIPDEALELFQKADPELQRLYVEAYANKDEFYSKFINYSVLAGEFKYNNFKSPKLKQGIQRIHLQAAFASIFEKSSKLIESLNSVRALEVCHYKEKLRCDVEFTEIQQIVQESNDPDELQYYWKEWRYVNQQLMKETLNLILRFVHKIEEHWNVSPLTYYFNRVMDESIIDDMEKVVKDMEPMYMEFHAFVRSSLIQEYGADVIPENGLIPVHLFEKLLEDSVNENEIWNALNQSNLTPRDVLEFSDGFFKNLGLDELPKDFWENRISQDTSNNCQPWAWDLSPKSFLTYCDKVNMRNFVETHQQMAQIYFANQKKDLAYGYFDSLNLDTPVGFAIRLATITSKHINSLGLINSVDYASEDAEKDRIKYLGISTILNIPIYYIHSKVLTDLFTGTVELDKINAHYWSLMEKHAGITPPISVKQDDINFPYDFYYEIFRNRPMSKFMVEVIGHQVYESLCEISKHDEIELHKCDFSKSLEAGKLLKEIMSTGSQKPWREILSIVTGNKDGMSAAPIKNYYSSLYKRIKEQNLKSEVEVGWCLDKLSKVSSKVKQCASNEETAAELFINQSSDKLYTIASIWSYCIFYLSFSEAQQEELESYYDRADPELKPIFTATEEEDLDEYILSFVDLSKQAGEFQYYKFKNAAVKQAIQKIHLLSAFTFVSFPDEAYNLTENIDSIRTLEICHLKENWRCDMNFSEIKETIQDTNDPEELKYYWTEWRYANQPLMKETLDKLVKYMQKISKHSNVTASTYFFSDLLDESLIDDMEKIVIEMEPMYMEFHTFVRSSLIKEYGPAVIPENGLIPAHLFEKFLEDTRSKNDMWNVLNQSNLTPRDVLEFSDGFFKNLGFDELPKYFWNHRINQDNSTECKPSAIDMSERTYLTYCDEVDMRIFLETHYQMAKIYTADQKKDLRYAYFSSLNFQDAIAYATRLATMTSKHMTSLGLINGTDYASEQAEKERLKHLGFSSILSLPISYVHTKVMTDLVTGTVELDKINTHYWSLMKKYAGLAPPIPVKEDDINFPYDFYDKIFHNTRIMIYNNFILEVIGHQIYESLCEISKHDDIELHRCDFSNNLEVGKALKEIMSTGCKKPWREILSIVTGNKDGMSAAPIKNYYSSLYKRIKEQNVKSGIRIGWE